MIAAAFLILHGCRTAILGGLRTMELVLHPGVHRTGTTTLQHLLRDNADRLAASGVAAWTPQRTRSGLFTGLIRRADLVSADQDRRAERARGLIGIECAHLEERGHDTLIVSEENIAGSVRQSLEAERLYPDFEDRLVRVRAAFAGPVRRIGLAIRSYDSWWSSALALSLVRGGALPGTDQLDRLVTQPRRWRDLIRAAARVAPEAEISVWSFERFSAHPGAVADILSGGRVGVGLGAPEWANRSPRAFELRQLVTGSGVSADPARLPPASPDRWMPFDESQRTALRAEYREDLDWLRAGAEGLATYHASHPVLEGRTGASATQQEDDNLTCKEDSGIIAAEAAQAMARSIGGHHHGNQGQLA